MLSTVFFSFFLVFLLTCILFPPYIELARRYFRKHIDKKLRPEMASLHAIKEGTPQLGGLLIITIISVYMIIFYDHTRTSFVILAIMWLFGFQGLWDDLLSAWGKKHLGLPLFPKIIIQSSICCVAASLIKNTLGVDSLFLPFSNVEMSLGWFYYPFAIVFLFVVTTSVNITDGLDGLAGSLLAFSFLFFLILFWRVQDTEVSLFIAILLGGLLAFLFFNEKPAKIFMGDTGSMSLGATLGVLALLSRYPLFIFVLGLPFFIESASVALQRLSKLLRGKKIFLLSPLHHHFEKLGYDEYTIVWGFRACGLFFFVLAFLLMMQF